MTSVLDLPPDQGQRSASFAFTLIETISGRLIGDVHPDRASVPSLEHDSGRPVNRRLSNLFFPADESEVIDPLVHSLRLTMIVDRPYPLGVYQFADDPYLRNSAGRRLRATMLDRGVDLQEQLDETFSVRSGTNVAVALRNYLDTVGFGNYQIDGSSAVTTAALTWPAGTVKSKPLSELAAAGAYLEPWVSSLDVLRVVRSFDPATVPPTFDYDDGPVIADSITESNDLLTAPNRFRVVDNSSVGTGIVGVYEIPPSAPHSRLNRGRYVTKTEARQGLSPVAADDAARALALQTPGFETVDFSVPPDPRHESFDVNRYRGENWLETRWVLPLVEGGAMQLRMQRAYRAA